MKFSIVGAGNMAWFLGQRLVTYGHVCRGVYSRNHASSADLAEELGTLPLDKPEYIREIDADLIILSVPDDAIPSVASLCTQTGATVLHTAGSVPIDSLGNDTVHKAVFWPIYSIRRTNLPAHRNIPALWQANTPQASNAVLELAESVTDTCMESSFDQRMLMHLCAVITNNFTNHLLDICGQICDSQHLPQVYLQPILQQTISNFGHLPLSGLQTGPAARHDLLTLEKHMELLKDHPYWQQIYHSISASINAGTQINQKK